MQQNFKKITMGKFGITIRLHEAFVSMTNFGSFISKPFLLNTHFLSFLPFEDTFDNQWIYFFHLFKCRILTRCMACSTIAAEVCRK